MANEEDGDEQQKFRENFMEIMESLVPTTHKITEERERLLVKVKTKIRKKNLKCHKSTGRVQSIDDIR